APISTLYTAYYPRQNRTITVPGRTVDVPRSATASEIPDSRFPSDSIPPRRQAGDVIGPRNVLALLIPDRRVIEVGLIGHHDIHRDLTMGWSFVADQGDRPQRRQAHLLRLLAPGELSLFLQLGPGPIRFLQLTLDGTVYVQLLVPHPAHEIDAVILFELAKQIRPPVAAIHQQNLQPLP